MCDTSPKIAIQLLSKFEPRAQQPGFYRGNRNTEGFSSLLRGKFFDVPQYKNNAEIRFQLVNDFGQNFMHFRLCESLFGAWSPILQLPGHEVLFSFYRLIKGKLSRAAFAQPHEPCVGSYSHQPCIEPGVFLEI